MSAASPDDAPYSHHMAEMRAQLAQSVFQQPRDDTLTAFLHAGGLVMQQLAALERGMIEQQGSWRPLWKGVQQPWVVGYCMNCAMAAIEKYGIDRGSSEAASVMVTLMQTVLLGGTYERIREIIASISAGIDK
jgi:hypothetical protein